MIIPIYRTVEVGDNPEVDRYSIPRYRIALVKEAEIDWPNRRMESPEQIYRLAKTIFEGYDREAVFVFLLDQKHNLIGINLVSVGSLTEALVHPREFFKSIILANAASFVFIHNHPSGDPMPSLDDRKLTDRIKSIATLVGVRMLDSLVVGETGYYSFVESGALQKMGQSVIKIGERDELQWGENPEIAWNPGVKDRLLEMGVDPSVVEMIDSVEDPKMQGKLFNEVRKDPHVTVEELEAFMGKQPKKREPTEAELFIVRSVGDTTGPTPRGRRGFVLNDLGEWMVVGLMKHRTNGDP